MLCFGLFGVLMGWGLVLCSVCVDCCKCLVVSCGVFVVGGFADTRFVVITGCYVCWCLLFVVCLFVCLFGWGLIGGGLGGWLVDGGWLYDFV